MSNDIDPSARVTTRCCVAGGGPAGMMLALLLARAGIAVSVLEKHADFLRDFRGDTIHPSTLEIMHELGLLDELLREPHQELREVGAMFGDASFAEYGLSAGVDAATDSAFAVGPEGIEPSTEGL